MSMTPAEFIGKAKFDEGSGYIFGNAPNGERIVAELRGWGTISNYFQFSDDAVAFQDQLGQFIADAINEKIERENQ
jgi:hypothetical protein